MWNLSPFSSLLNCKLEAFVQFVFIFTYLVVREFCIPFLLYVGFLPFQVRCYNFFSSICSVTNNLERWSFVKVELTTVEYLHLDHIHSSRLHISSYQILCHVTRCASLNIHQLSVPPLLAAFCSADCYSVSGKWFLVNSFFFQWITRNKRSNVYWDFILDLIIVHSDRFHHLVNDAQVM